MRGAPQSGFSWLAVAEPDATAHLALQHNQLLPERGIFGFKSALGLDECRQQVEGRKNQRNHSRKRDVIPSPVQCGRGFRYTQVDGIRSSQRLSENPPGHTDGIVRPERAHSFAYAEPSQPAPAEDVVGRPSEIECESHPFVEKAARRRFTSSLQESVKKYGLTPLSERDPPQAGSSLPTL
jgi:hypothetical protein